MCVAFSGAHHGCVFPKRACQPFNVLLSHLENTNQQFNGVQNIHKTTIQTITQKVMLHD